MDNIDNGFVKQTALDYDMAEFQVRIIYDNYYDDGLFYEKLEEFIKQRANSYT